LGFVVLPLLSIAALIMTFSAAIVDQLICGLAPISTIRVREHQQALLCQGYDG
jgi:hypothetical protein